MFDEILSAGGSIMSFNQHHKDNYYGVHIVDKGGKLKFFPNISDEHLKKYVYTGEHQHLDTDMHNAGTITEFHKHEGNDHYTVHVVAKDGKMHTFSNITEEHLRKYVQPKSEE